MRVPFSQQFSPSQSIGERARESVKKLGGRASWRAIALAGPCPMRLGGSLALPLPKRRRSRRPGEGNDSIFSHVQGRRGGTRL
jgi:hypothetical protein